MEQLTKECKSNLVLIFSQLDAKEKSNYESKLHTFAVVYRTLTGKTTKFHFDN